MSKKYFYNSLFISIILISFFLVLYNFKKENQNLNKLEICIMSIDQNTITVQDNNNIIYTFTRPDHDFTSSKEIIIEYTGTLDPSQKIQTSKIINYYETKEAIKTTKLFQDYYKPAKEKVKTMTLKEKIAQLLLVRYPEKNQQQILQKYQFGGFIFYEKDFKNKTEKEVQEMITSLQKTASIPLLTAVDEEGGSVIRISSNSKLVSEPFKSSQELYALGGFQKIKEDTERKSKILANLGINLNLAPVVDVSTDQDDYMFKRSFGKNTELTALYAKSVIEASKKAEVSYTLKHFPGYGKNIDTHLNTSIDNRTLQDIFKKDLPPFSSGIKAGAEAVLISHNIVNCIDEENPASLSPNIHNLLYKDLQYTGITITDDIAMGALNKIDQPTLKAILVGNNIIITTNYETSIHELETSIEKGIITEEFIDKLATNVLAWKYYKGLFNKYSN